MLEKGVLQGEVEISYKLNMGGRGKIWSCDPFRNRSKNITRDTIFLTKRERCLTQRRFQVLKKEVLTLGEGCLEKRIAGGGKEFYGYIFCREVANPTKESYGNSGGKVTLLSRREAKRMEGGQSTLRENIHSVRVWGRRVMKGGRFMIVRGACLIVGWDTEEEVGQAPRGGTCNSIGENVNPMGLGQEGHGVLKDEKGLVCKKLGN